MIKVTIKNIIDYGLPLDDDRKVMQRGCSKKILEELEKKYNCKTNDVCRKISSDGFEIYVNAAYGHIPYKEKDKWVVNYEVYIRSSIVYKFWIWFYRIKNKFD